MTQAPTAYPLAWPDELIDDRLAFVGTSGSGKTYAAKGLAERLIRLGTRLCIVDPLGVWWGLRSGVDGDASGGLPVTIFGGLHADVPITEHDGGALGRIVAGADIRCIVDVSELASDAARRRFALHFAEALYNANRELLHLILDEADFFAPQNSKGDDGPGPALLGRISQIVRRGRVRGFIPWLITQRPAVLNKNVLSQVVALVAMKLTGSQDRDAIGAWIEGQADRDEGKRILAELPRLKIGTGYIWAPAQDILRQVVFPPNATFDSSAPPKRGESIGTTTLAPVDVAAIGASLAQQREPAKIESAPNGIDVESIRESAYRRGRADAEAEMIDLRDQMRRMQGAITGALGFLVPFVERPADGGVPVIDVIRAPEPLTIEAAPKRGGADRDIPTLPVQPRRGAEMRIMKVLAERHPARLTVAQWATLAAMKRTGGTWGTYVSRLRTAGFLDERDGLVSATPSGLAAADVRAQRPRSPAEVRAMWKKAVGGAGKFIDILLAARGGLSREQIAANAGMAITGGTFGSYLSRLRSNGLIIETGSVIRLVEELR